MYLLAEGIDGGHTSARKAKAFLVDPADPKALHKIAALEGVGQVEIVGVLTTHHHKDHAGGNGIIVSLRDQSTECLLNVSYQAEAIPSALIYGGQPKNGRPQVKAITNVVRDGDELTLGDSIKIK
jgi:hydroxyacylglutathione hydrolase